MRPRPDSATWNHRGSVGGQFLGTSSPKRLIAAACSTVTKALNEKTLVGRFATVNTLPKRNRRQTETHSEPSISICEAYTADTLCSIPAFVCLVCEDDIGRCSATVYSRLTPFVSKAAVKELPRNKLKALRVQLRKSLWSKPELPIEILSGSVEYACIKPSRWITLRKVGTLSELP